MKRTILIIAAVLLASGLTIFFAALATCGFDFAKLNGEEYEEKTYTIDGNFADIEIAAKETDIIFKPSASGATVSCFESENITYTVKTDDGTLKIILNDGRKWYERFTLVGATKTMTVYLPAKTYENLKIESGKGDVKVPNDFTFKSVDIAASTGDVDFCAATENDAKITASTGSIKVKGVAAKSFEFSVSTGRVVVENSTLEEGISIKFSTGKVKLSGVNCKNLSVSGSTGDAILSGVIATDNFDIKTSTGDVSFDKCDAAEIKIRTSTGDVSGTFNTGKEFITETSTGKVRIPKNSVGGKCEITTSTGDISITIAAAE